MMSPCGLVMPALIGNGMGDGRGWSGERYLPEAIQMT